jgi:hypothetical protein
MFWTELAVSFGAIDLGAVSPTWAFVISLIFQAAWSGWFMRGLKTSRDAILADIEQQKRNMTSLSTTVASDLLEQRRNFSDLQTAVGVQGSEIANLRSDYGQIQELVLVTMPKVVDQAIRRAEARAAAAERIAAAYRSRRRQGH